MNISAPLRSIATEEAAALKYVNSTRRSPDIRKGLRDLLIAIRSLSVEEPVLNLVAIRASQLNQCAPCLALHIGLAKFHGEHPMRLCHLAAWRDSNLFGPRERAALEWAEAVTTLTEQGPVKAVHAHVRAQLSENEASNIVLVVTVVKLWSRLNIVSSISDSSS